MKNTELVLEALKELATMTKPGLVMKEDLRCLESRLDELELLLDELESRLITRTDDGDEAP